MNKNISLDITSQTTSLLWVDVFARLLNNYLLALTCSSTIRILSSLSGSQFYSERNVSSDNIIPHNCILSWTSVFDIVWLSLRSQISNPSAVIRDRVYSAYQEGVLSYRNKWGYPLILVCFLSTIRMCLAFPGHRCVKDCGHLVAPLSIVLSYGYYLNLEGFLGWNNYISIPAYRIHLMLFLILNYFLFLSKVRICVPHR